MSLIQAFLKRFSGNNLILKYWYIITKYTRLLLYGWKCHAKIDSLNPLRSIKNISNITMRIITWYHETINNNL